MRKLLTLLTLLILAGFVLVGCADDDADDMNDDQAMANETEADAEEETDAMSRPTEMVATDAESLQEAVSADGPWIIIFESDLSVDQAIEVEGEVFQEEGDDAPRRKLAMYAQDAERNVTERYTLTVPELIIESPNTRIQSGTVAGNVLVAAEGFELVRGATIDGNLIFETEELRDSATVDDSSSVTGEIRVED